MSPSATQEQINFYENRTLLFAEKEQKLQTQSRLLSFLRVFLALSILATLIWGYQQPLFWFAIATEVSLFLLLVQWHNRVSTRLKFTQSLAQVNRNEVAALNHNFTAFEDGESYKPAHHDFANDLDIFGAKSLFQILNRAGSSIGQSRLADWLSYPLNDKKRINQRQKAVTELKPLVEFRQNLLAHTTQIKQDDGDLEQLYTWLNAPNEFSKFIFKLVCITTPILTATLLTLAISGTLSFGLFMLYLAVPYAISAGFGLRINRLSQRVGKLSSQLSNYSKAIQAIEQEPFSEEFKTHFTASFFKTAVTPSRAINRLSKTVSALDSRSNFVVWLVMNALVQWDILQVVRLEGWKKEHRHNLKIWLQTLSEIEALNGLSTFAFNNPEAIFPEVSSSQSTFHFTATNLSHPIIPKNECVANPITISNYGQFAIITGANMAGKSTYLRTVGVNLVLAQCGSVVLASEMQLSVIRLFTGIRITDSLQDSESYFFAELKRLQEMVTQLERGESLFVLLDEILRGTNSEDKRKGSYALIKKLLSFKSSGVVATHDLTLGTLEEAFPKQVNNYHFDFQTSNAKMSFDYLLKPGIAHDMNATLLMEQMGIL